MEAVAASSRTISRSTRAVVEPDQVDAENHGAKSATSRTADSGGGSPAYRIGKPYHSPIANTAANGTRNLPSATRHNHSRTRDELPRASAASATTSARQDIDCQR